MGLGRAQGLAERCLGLSGVLVRTPPLSRACARRSCGRRRRLLARGRRSASLRAARSRHPQKPSVRSRARPPRCRTGGPRSRGPFAAGLGDESEARAARQAQAAAGARLEAALKALELDGSTSSSSTSTGRGPGDGSAALVTSQRKLSEKLESIASQIDALELSRSRCEQAVRNSERRLAAAEDTAEAAGREHDRADARAESLAGAQEVLQGTAGRQALTGAAGVRGALADLVEVDTGFEVAFAAAISGALESVVVDGSHAADAVALLRVAQRLGDVAPGGGRAADPILRARPARPAARRRFTSLARAQRYSRGTRASRQASRRHCRRAGWVGACSRHGPRSSRADARHHRRRLLLRRWLDHRSRCSRAHPGRGGAGARRSASRCQRLRALP